MTNLLQIKTYASVLVETLCELKVDSIFGYPGASVLSIYNELSKVHEIKHYLVRHEQAAVHAAEGYARASGKTGVVLVTSGPGFTNTITGIANAYADSTPLVILAGDVSTANKQGKIFQNVDITSITKSCSKKIFNLTDSDDIASVIKEAFKEASTGVKGPVVVILPRNILENEYTNNKPQTTPQPEIHTQDFSKEIEELILSKKADMVIGDRLSSTYFEENKRRFHNSGNKLVRKLINTIFNSDISDIMTGMRGFSYEFVKSFPISSKEFEIETEMTIFALNHNFLIKELPIEYRDRMDGSESKLNTFSDGYKVISLLFGLFRDIRPLFFFSLVTLVLLIIAGLYFFPILIDFYRTGFVEKVPTLITVGVVAIVAVIIFFTGVVLHVIRKQHDENFEHHLNLIAQNKKR